ncbi:MAG TPA: NAD(P)-dependent oxidoreductase [Streptosporangiaceae bacterium]|nr:NAD(P)-dependent oxidoreductase [Streptosporangiaceae bacterium]
MRVFVAGGTGAIGQHLIPLLVGDGHEVTATTRSQAKAATLEKQGATPAVVDGLDRADLIEAVRAAEPEVIIHQMTALSALKDFRNLDRDFAQTNELRTRGTDYLLEAARLAGTRRVIAQGYIGWNNARAGGMIKTEEDPTDTRPAAHTAMSLAAINHVERTVPAAVPEGLVLRYGSFYGPGSSDILIETVRKRRLPIVGSGDGVWSFVEITDAARATAKAVTSGAPGIYNIVDDDPAPVREWLPYLAECLGVKAPLHVPAWLGKIAAGELAVMQMTQVRGSANGKAKRDLGWRPEFASWRDGFRHWIAAGND